MIAAVVQRLREPDADRRVLLEAVVLVDLAQDGIGVGVLGHEPRPGAA
jgi:hypothetical protein